MEQPDEREEGETQAAAGKPITQRVREFSARIWSLVLVLAGAEH